MPDVSWAAAFIRKVTSMPTLTINGQEQHLDVPDDMPLLWALRDVVGLTGTKFGCGIALCGACTVHLDGRPIRSCITPVANVVGKKITTVEAIGETESGAKIQRAWLNVEVVQCGYCQSGQIMSAAALTRKQPKSQRRRNRCRHVRQHLPLRHLSANSRCNQTSIAIGLRPRAGQC